MDTSKKRNLVAAGMAIFAMFFGAGNIVFPLALGQFALDKAPWALIGLLVTSVIMPFAGLIAMYFYQGRVDRFFNPLGRIPGLLLATLSVALIGPLGCAPRCITLAYSTMSVSFPGISLFVFSLFFSIFLFFFLWNPGRILGLVGYVLSPFKIILLVSVIIIGLMNMPEVAPATTDESRVPLFLHGLKEGYNTLDLVASFFFAPIILSSLSSSNKGSLGPFFVRACMMGGVLLGSVYTGFCFLAYLYAPFLQGVPAEKLLGTIATFVLGPKGGMIVAITVTLTCFTTTIAVIAAFSNFLKNELLGDRVSYVHSMIITVLVTFLLANLGFAGIANILTPVLKFCYPILIGLTIYNLISYFVPGKSIVLEDIPLDV